MIKPRLSIDQKAGKKAQSFIYKLKTQAEYQPDVEVGYWRNEEMHKVSNVDLVEIAVKNEFGLGNTPARPFMKRTVTVNKKLIVEKIREIESDIVQNILNARQGMQQIGLFIIGLVKKTIASSKSWAKENSPSTVAAKKGADTPLVHYGEMMSKVNYKLVKK